MGEQTTMEIGPAQTTEKAPLPKNPAEQVDRKSQRVQSRSVQPLLESLTALGQARLTDSGHFSA